MKTKIIGLTGGIGSGKSTIGAMFEKEGFPIYIADDRAKNILLQANVIEQIKQEFGTEILDNGLVDRKKLAKIVFENSDFLKKLNAIIHPFVQIDFENWLVDQKQHPFVIKESAILFETGTNKNCFKIITVSAPLEARIKRVMNRDRISKQEVLLRIDKQLTDHERELKSDFVIHNIELSNTINEVKNVIWSIKKSISPIKC
jgi:dephospho-CoA kinase